MAQEEGDTRSYNSHQSTNNSTSALHDDNTRRRKNNDDAASTNTEKSKAGKLMARISGVRDLLGVVFLPILNVIFTAIMMGLLIYAYSTANGKPLDYTIGSMNVPTFVSLITTLLKMGIMGGIGYAISEYKWVRFQNGGQLSLLDVYDACTRGVGGVIRVLLSIRMDTILIPAVIFQIGLIALGPAAQEILANYDETVSCYIDPPGRPLYVKTYHSWQWYKVPQPHRAPQLKGIKQDYVPKIGFGAAYANSTTGLVNYMYNLYSINTTWHDVATMRNDIDCVTGSYADTRIINDQTLNVSTLSEYFGSGRPIDVPRMFYAESMYNRTHYDRERLFFDILDTTAYHPEDRPLVGDQTVVIVTEGRQAISSSLNNPEEEATVEICTLRSYITNSTMVESGTLNVEIRPTWENKRLIDMDYDRLLNGSVLDLSFSETGDHTYDNAYAYQLSLIATMTDPKNAKFHRKSADRWATAVPENVENVFTNYIRDGFYMSDLFMTFYAPEEDSPSRAIYGDACFANDTTYNFDQGAYLGLSLAPVVPLAWWVVLWIISLYQTNGISRGNSQIALMATGLTHRVSDRFKGFSHTGQAQIFSRASKVKAWFGEIRRSDGRRGHVAFGLEDEIQPLRVRNQRNDEAAA
ncbi:predicted protein [Lichtheimia corymbifera JMRC:FSU:9682]|uniref:Uncharacterized protein n=1 Tax=Lichtheimia corymbifera JMRC:FSU:9682 TaxID=1263082 RepID=A0A068S7E1_9FUNG|nr:predicted protein [Lichtheimia corymbifera JMRC:FSU:9682]